MSCPYGASDEQQGASLGDHQEAQTRGKKKGRKKEEEPHKANRADDKSGRGGEEISSARILVSPRASGEIEGGAVPNGGTQKLGNYNTGGGGGDSRAVLHPADGGSMTEEERDRQRKKAVQNLDNIIMSLQELEDLPQFDPTMPRGLSPSYDSLGGKDRWPAGPISRQATNNSSLPSSSTSTTGHEADESYGLKGSDPSLHEKDATPGGGGVNAPKEKDTNVSAVSNHHGALNKGLKEKEKEKEGNKKSGGLVRLSIFHKRPKDRTETAKKTLRGKKLQSKGEEAEQDEGQYVKVEKKNKKKDAVLSRMYKVQTVSEREGGHFGAIWVMQFSPDGRYLATAGSDGILRVWRIDPQAITEEGKKGRFKQYLNPVCVKAFSGHTLDILSISWSNDKHLLSSSMDCTVRLWHLGSEECITCFEHRDFVTVVAFHPVNNQVFISGGLDKRIYLWNITHGQVVCQVDIPDVITACAFLSSKGEQLIVGTDAGRLLFYDTEAFRASTGSSEAQGLPSPRTGMRLSKEHQVHNSRFKGKDHRRKIAGIETTKDGAYTLVSSNDSSVRLFRTKDFSLVCKYAGHVNKEFQTKATLSEDGKYILSGSEDPSVYLWELGKDKQNKMCECFHACPEEEGMTTVAIFAPQNESVQGQIILAATLEGDLQVYHNEQIGPES